MSNVIAVIWDCDKTLIKSYMQSPMFKDLKIDEKQFWNNNNKLPELYEKTQGIRVNPDTIYLNSFIHLAQEREDPLINNEWLKSYGKKLEFYEGVPKFLQTTKDLLKNSEDREAYEEYHITVEHYIVSTGFKAVIDGSVLKETVDGIWGCELIESGEEDKKRISEVGYTIDNTTKTRALFEINKGVGKLKGISVNDKIPDDQRRIPFSQMIYIADGPSDIPAFSVVNKGGGYTIAVYPHGDEKALAQVEALREAGRVKMYCEADYQPGTQAYMLITMKIKDLANSILKKEREKMQSFKTNAPSHIV